MPDAKVKVVVAVTGADKLNVIVPDPLAISVRGDGVSVAVLPTVICDCALARPDAVAVIVVVPEATPFKVGSRVGVVEPALKDTLVKFKLAIFAFPTANVTVTALVGAAARVTVNGVVPPGPTVTVAGTIMPMFWVTVTGSVAEVMPGALAVMTAVPAATPVTGMLTVVELAAIV